MKNRILKGWTLIRVLYTIAGIAVVIQSSITHSWFGVAFGLYFTSMGVFGFGCAAGNCFGGSCDTPEYRKASESDQVSFEEVKKE